MILVAYLGALFNGLVGGIALGLLFSFQGVFIGTFSNKTTFRIGTQFGVFWLIFPLAYIYIHYLNKWSVDHLQNVPLTVPGGGFSISNTPSGSGINGKDLTNAASAAKQIFYAIVNNAQSTDSNTTQTTWNITKTLTQQQSQAINGILINEICQPD